MELSPDLLPEQHPILPNLTREEVERWIRKDPDDYVQWLTTRRDQIAKWDPENDSANLYHTGYIQENWRRAKERLNESALFPIFGGNGSAKTWFAAWLGTQMLTRERNRHVLWLHESEKASIDVQQAAVYTWLPHELRGTKKGPWHNTEFTAKNGFPGGVFTLPNKSKGVFGYYGQDVKVYEGGGWHLILADENLPLDWLQTLMYRLPRRGGKMIWTFTPIRGITPAVREVVTDAKTVEQRRAELLPEDHVIKGADAKPGHAPTLQHGLKYDARIAYWFTEDNPFSGYAQQVQQAKGATVEELERRFYGWARDTKGRMFPNFGAHCIVDPQDIPAGGTNYLVVDPVLDGPRNWFMVWFKFLNGVTYVYRDWPDDQDHGEWALPTSKSPDSGGIGWDGDPGPAQPKLGYGYAEYKELMIRLETETVHRRLFDPRASGTEVLEKHGGTNLIDQMAMPHTSLLTGEEVEGLDFEPAIKCRDDDPIALMDSAMKINPNQPVGPDNFPRLVVSSECKQVIWALQNFTGKDGRRGACKDPIDCVKYYFTSDATWGELELNSTGGGSY